MSDEVCLCPKKSCINHGNHQQCELKHLRSGSATHCQKLAQRNACRNNRRPIIASSVVKIAAALFLILVGVMTIILLHYAGISTDLYISVFFLCISASVYLLSSVLVAWLIRRKGLEPCAEKLCLRQSHLVAGGISFMLFSILSVILMSSFGISPSIYISCYVALVAVSLAIISTGIYKVSNGMRQA